MRLARALISVLVVAAALAACGGGGDADRAAQPCDDTAPDPGATFATADVAFAAREGEEVQSARGTGYLPWFAKFDLYVRGEGNVVIRVPEAQQDEVNIVGWGVEGDAPPRTDILIESASRCWTGYPGGLIFTGRPCVQLQVEGPGALRGTARFGLRRECGPETLTDREQFVIAGAELAFATIALDAIDHEACLKEATERRCEATGERQVERLLKVFRAKPDGVYTLRDGGDVPVRDVVAEWADQLRDGRPELAAALAAAL
jgi:hypothetical protein